MGIYWKNLYPTIFTERGKSNGNLAKLLLPALLLVPGFATAITSQIPTLNTQQQNSTILSLHETTELAETLWADLTNHFLDLYEQGDYQAALATAQRSYTIAKNNFGLNDVNTADALLKLGIINQTLGNLREAENNLLASLVILQERLSPDHPDVAVTLTNLGNIYFELQQPTESEKYHKQALQIRKNAFGPEHPSVAQSIYNLAVLYENSNDYNKAARYYRKAIDSWSVSIGPTHPYVGNALNNLSNIYIAQAEHEKAIRVLRRTVSFKKSVYGRQHEEVAQTLISLGTSYLEQGQYNPASNAYKEALDIAQHILRSSDPQLALLMYTLANIYHTQAQLEEQKLNTSTREKTAVYQTGSSDKSPAPANLSSSKTVSLFAQALPLYEKAAEILDDGKNETQSVLDVVLTELALLYKEIGNTDMAMATESRITAH